MQPYEIATLILFLVFTLVQAVRDLVTPGTYKEAEMRFYTTGKAGPFELLIFFLSFASFVLLVIHLTKEQPKIGQLLLYVQVIMFTATIPLNFIPFLRKRTKNTLSRKSTANYRTSGLGKLALAALTVLVPFILTR